MTTMTSTAAPLGLPHGRPLTYDDLEHLPDDGHRYELIDGVLVVSPAPRPLHQRVVGELYVLLREACGPELELLMAPLDVKLTDDSVLNPDLVLARTDAYGERFLPGAPLLAIEVLSPSTQSFDRHTKKDRLRRAGCVHYWIVDPGLRDGVPSVTAWRLEGDDYVVVGEASGSDELSLAEPVAVTVAPQRLIER